MKQTSRLSVQNKVRNARISKIGSRIRDGVLAFSVFFNSALPSGLPPALAAATAATLPLAMSGCKSIEVITAPQFQNPPIGVVERDDGRLHSPFVADQGQDVRIMLTDVNAPILAENQTVVKGIVGGHERNITTRQRNTVTFQGSTSIDDNGVLKAMGLLTYRMEFATTVQDDGEFNGSSFSNGTPVVVLGQKRFVSTPYSDRQNGEIHLGDMQIHQRISENQEVKVDWKDPANTSEGSALVKVFLKVIGVEYEDAIFNTKKLMSASFGTETPSGRHAISTPSQLSPGVSYGITFPEGSEQRNLGVINMHIEPYYINNENSAYCSLFVNSGEISPNQDSITHARYGNVQVDVIRSGSRVQAVEFSMPVLLTENVELRVFNSDLSLWVGRDVNTSKPVIVFSSPYL